MTTSPIELEIYFQLSQAIGTAQELEPMLRTALTAYLRKLDCAIGIVWRAEASGTALTRVYSIPRRIDQVPGLADLERQLQQQRDSIQDGQCLPLSDPLLAQTLLLPGFGLLLLARPETPLPERIVKSLAPLNEKLALACRACDQALLQRQTTQQLQREVTERKRFQLALEEAQHQLEQRVDLRTRELDQSNRNLQREVERRRQVEQALRESEETFRSIFENAGAGLNTISPDGIILKVNPAFARMIGYAPEELEGKRVVDITHPDSRALSKRLYAEVRDNQRRDFTYEKQFLRKDGFSLWAQVTNAWVLDAQGKPLHAVSLVQDITERKRAEAALKRHEARLNYLAYHDTLTNLPNRALFYDRLEHAIASAQRSQHSLAVLFLDLDRFKTVNDSLGHQVGDQLLVRVAERLRNCTRASDTLARLGGDEFVIIVEQLEDYREALKVAQAILCGLDTPLSLSDRDLVMTASIGISIFPSDGDSVDALMKAADVAMYRAKAAGRNGFQFYTADMDSEVHALLTLEGELRRALDRNQLHLHYQPIVDLASGQVQTVEALARWHHPERGPIPPDDFIPVAEETGLITPLGEWALREACRQTVAWHRQGMPLSVSINISTRQFRGADFVDMVEQVLADCGLGPEWLLLEITESALMANIDRSILTLVDLKQRNIRLAVDDFGTGYSSLNYLKRFPIEALKIDRSFVRDVLADSHDAAIVSAVIALGRSMNLKVVAEGIETEEQLHFVRDRGCDLGQGYLFSRPVPPEKVPELVGQVLPAR